jgi:hypothetical protein
MTHANNCILASRCKLPMVRHVTGRVALILVYTATAERAEGWLTLARRWITDCLHSRLRQHAKNKRKYMRH